MLLFSMNLKSSFQKLSLLQKVKLYIVVIIFYILIFYIYDKFYNKNKTIKTTSKISTESIDKIKSLKSKITTKTTNHIVKLIEQRSDKLNCFISDIKIKKNNINLTIEGNIYNIINFLNYLQNHFIIEQFNLEYQKDILSSTISLNTKYFYNPNKIYNKITNLPNPFINIKNETFRKIEKFIKPLKVDAIVDSNIFINNKWYKLNDIIDGKRIISIKLNIVKFIDIKTSKVTYIKVYNEAR